MSPKVLSILPRIRFQNAGVALPPELEFHFENVTTEQEIIEAGRDMDFLFLPAAFPLITKEILENIPSVKMIQSAGTGYDKVDVESAARLNIPVANSPGANVTTVAEVVIAMLIALQRRMFVSDREIKAGNYGPIREQLFSEGLKEVCDLQLGLVGLGAIGRKVAQIAGLLGAGVSYFDVYRLPEDNEKKLGVTYKNFDDLLRTSNAVSMHIPLTPRTRDIIGAREFNLMPQGALFVNTARGEIVDPKALAQALESKHLAGAGLDTVSPEPPPPEHPLLNLSPAVCDRLLVTPHIAGTTRGAFGRMLRAAIANILRAAAGHPPKHVVNGISEIRHSSDRP